MTSAKGEGVVGKLDAFRRCLGEEERRDAKSFRRTFFTLSRQIWHVAIFVLCALKRTRCLWIMLPDALVYVRGLKIGFHLYHYVKILIENCVTVLWFRRSITQNQLIVSYIFGDAGPLIV